MKLLNFLHPHRQVGTLNRVLERNWMKCESTLSYSTQTFVNDTLRFVPEFGMCLLDGNAFNQVAMEEQIGLIQRAMELTNGNKKTLPRNAIEACISRLNDFHDSKLAIGGSVIFKPQDSLMHSCKMIKVQPTDWIITRQALFGATPSKLLVPIKSGREVTWDNRFRIALDSLESSSFYGKDVENVQFTVKPVRKSDYLGTLNRLESLLKGTAHSTDPLLDVERFRIRMHHDALKLYWTELSQVVIPCISYMNAPQEILGLIGSDDLVVSIPSLNIDMHPSLQSRIIK